MSPNTNSTPPQQSAPLASPGGGEVTNYRSADGAVEVVTKVSTANRSPQHNYKVVCLKLRPKNGTRIQLLKDGSGGVDVLLTHPEIAAHLEALKLADPKFSGIVIPYIPAKPAERKEHWDRINAEKWKNRKQQ